jgi:hypothetical protein
MWPQPPDRYPAPPRFVGDCYAALAEAQYEPKIEPNRLLNDLRRESVSGVVICDITLATEPTLERIDGIYGNYPCQRDIRYWTFAYELPRIGF